MIDLGGKSVFLSGPVMDLAREDAWNRFLDAEKTCVGVGARYVFNPMRRVTAQATHEEAMGIPCAELGELRRGTEGRDGRV